MLHLCRRFVIVGTLLGALLLQGCLFDNEDPQAKTETSSLGKYYASSLGAVALKIQNAVLNDPSWFVKTSKDSSLDFAQYGLTQPPGISTEIKSSICPLSSGKELTQITWINGENIDGKFALKEIGTSINDIMVSLRERVGSDQMGIYRGNGSIALGNGALTSIPSTCQSTTIPIGAPVIVFSIAHPAQPATGFARTEYRSVSCGVDANNVPLRGIKVESRTITFSAEGKISPTDPTEGWKTEDIGKCLEDVQLTVDSHERSDQASSVLNNFAGVGSGIKNTLDDQLKMNCTKMTVSVNGKNDDNWTFNNCAGATASGATALNARAVGNQSDVRQLSCSGLMQDTTVTISGVQANISNVAWATDSRNIVNLKRDITLNQMSGQQSANENNRDRWIGDSLDCKATQTVKIACTDIPGAPTLQERLSDIYAKTLLSPDGVKAYAVNMDYYTGTWLAEDGGVTLSRSVSAKDWIDAKTFTPKITSDNWKIVNDECAWRQRTLLPPESAGELPTYDPAKQGNWTPTHSAGFRPVTIMAPVAQGTGNQATDYAYDYRQNGDYATYIEIMNALGGNGTNGNGASGNGTNGGGTNGNGAGGNGTNGGGTNGNGTGGSGTNGSGTNGSGTTGNGAGGNGTNGSGTNGNGTNGNGAGGNGTNGSGTNGNGTNGNGASGNGTTGGGTNGNGTGGNGTNGNGASGNGTTGGGTNGNGTGGNGTNGNGTNGNDVYAPSDYMKSWEVEIPGGTRVITLLNHGDSPTHEGVISSSKTQIDENNNLSVVPNGFADPVRFGVDDKYEWTVPLYRYLDDVLVETTTVTLTYSEYREWSGVSYTDGSWSLPSITKVTNMDGVDRGGPWDDRERAPKSFEERTYSPPAVQACPSLSGAPTSQQSCDLLNPSVGAIHIFKDYGNDENGCPRGGYCHQETFDECVSRKGGYTQAFDWHGTIIRDLPDYGCCQAYYPGGHGLNAGDACTGYYPQMFGLPRR